MVLRALGTIIDFPKDGLSKHELYTGLLDYYDDWNSQDPDLAAYQPDLCRHANSLGHDLVNMATYAHIVLEALDRLPDDSGTVVIASAMAEAFEQG